MSAALQQLHFLQPWWLLALCVLPLAWWVGRRRDAASVALSRLVDAELLPHLLRGQQANRSLAPWLFLGAWTLGTLALAGLQFGNVFVAVQPPLFSMPSELEELVSDLWATGISPTDHPIRHARPGLDRRGPRARQRPSRPRHVAPRTRRRVQRD